MFRLLSIAAFAFFLSGCGSARTIGRTARATLLADSALRHAHVGITVYEPSTGKYWYDHQGDKYFVPASNTKIPTCYAAMKYLGDSLVGLRYAVADSQLYILPTGDPTLLHRDFPLQPVFDFLKRSTTKLAFMQPAWLDTEYGPGWTWSDYGESYMPERSSLPVYGNTVVFTVGARNGRKAVVPDIAFFAPLVTEHLDSVSARIAVSRRRLENRFDVSPSNSRFSRAEIPFQTYENQRLLEDTLHKRWLTNVYPATPLAFYEIHSQPTDSLLKPMMHRSDNFFAEQALLMAANEKLGVMSEQAIIDTLLKTDFADLPQKPRWVDGSGLSRYNLFTPRDLVAILGKMERTFGAARVRTILATGNEGTLTNYYKAASGHFFGKTGTLSGVVALSGYLETVGGRHLIVSVLVNNHQGSATAVRRAVETFVEGIRTRY
jgi:D-alanyl-D-alanine carboxypeptidase/D-alanyl-D-alanine-endopeptidase (penicillin-binding protein 4)